MVIPTTVSIVFITFCPQEHLSVQNLKQLHTLDLVLSEICTFLNTLS